MKLKIERSVLLRSLSHMQSVVERRNTIPILSNVRLDASAGGNVRLTATDMDIAVVESIVANVDQQGGATAPAHMLYDIARKLPDGAEVQISTKAGGGKLVLEAGRFSMSVSCLPVEDFPVMSDGELPFNFSIAGPDLKRLFLKTRFAISQEETRHYLNGIYLHSDKKGNGTLRAVATDGHRLACVDTSAPKGAENIPGIIVPRKVVGEVLKLLEESEAEVKVSLSETKVRFSLESVILTSKLIDGSFPDYARVIPSANDQPLAVDRKAFTRAVDLVSTVSTEKSRAVKIGLGDNKIVVSAVGPDAGSAEEEVDAGFAGDAFDIGFNARYVLDMVDQIEGDSVEFILADSASPTLVRDPEDASVVFVIMPMRV